MSLHNHMTSPTSERPLARFGTCLRTTWALGSAVVAVIAGISTLNMVSANHGMATLNEIASPFTQYFGRK